MAETTADVRRDIEMTRERISTTLAQLEQKTNVAQIVRDHPWPVLAAAVGVGVLLSGSKADIKAAGATVAATKGASSKLGGVLDEALANLVGGFHQAFQGHVDSIVEDLKKALGTQNLGNAGGNAGVGGARSGSVSDKVAKLMSNAGADAASDGSRGSPSLAGSGASGSPMTTGSGASGTSSGGGSWAPQTPDAVSAASVVSSTSPNTARAD
jgi:hypothetical protein